MNFADACATVIDASGVPTPGANGGISTTAQLAAFANQAADTGITEVYWNIITDFMTSVDQLQTGQAASATSFSAIGPFAS